MRHDTRPSRCVVTCAEAVPEQSYLEFLLVLHWHKHGDCLCRSGTDSMLLETEARYGIPLRRVIASCYLACGSWVETGCRGEVPRANLVGFGRSFFSFALLALIPPCFSKWVLQVGTPLPHRTRSPVKPRVDEKEGATLFLSRYSWVHPAQKRVGGNEDT